MKDLRTRWATMTAVIENHPLQEDWQARHDSGRQWSHYAVVPLYLAYPGLMGLKPLAPGFKRLELRPQLADLKQRERASKPCAARSAPSVRRAGRPLRRVSKPD